MRGRLFGPVLIGVLAVAWPSGAGAWTPDGYFYGTGGHAHGGGWGYSSSEDCDLQPPYTETSTVSPDEDHRVFADVRHVTQVLPRTRRNFEHVFHHLNRVHHVVHDVNQDVYVQNVRVHHNVVHDQTVHHYRHHTNYIQQDVDQNLYEHEALPAAYESDCDPEASD